MRLGITGGIGAGKSYVSRLLTEHFGVPVYDCDRAARRLMESSPDIRAGLTALVGPDAYLPDGTLNKPAVARYLFAAEQQARQVNAIVHPAVKADFAAWALQREHRERLALVAVESALLADAGMADSVDAVLLVEAPLEVRVQRAMARDGAQRQQIEARIRQQLSAANYRLTADFILINDGRDLLPSLNDIMQALTQ